MSLTEALEALRADSPGCEFAAFTDLSSAMVLTVTGSRSHPRERMDALAAEAVALLDGAGLAEILDALGGEPARRIDEAAVSCPGHAHVFVRAPDEPTEAVALVCAPGVPAGPLVSSARAFFGVTAAGS